MHVIFKKLDLTPVYGTLTSITTLGQSEIGSNYNTTVPNRI